MCVKTFIGREDIILTHATIALYAAQGVCFTPQIHIKFDGCSSNSVRHHQKCNNIMQTILSTTKCYYDKKDVEASSWFENLMSYQSLATHVLIAHW